MRRFALALTAASLTVPAVPTIAVAHDKSNYHGKTWRDSQGRLRCKRPNGTTGLIVGAAGGAGAAQGSAAMLQQRYDVSYVQCMYAKGHQVPASGRYEGSRRPYAAPPPAPPYGAPPPPPPR